MRPTFTSARFWLHHPREWLALLLLVLLQCSCTTLADRRDLYSPEPAPNAMPPVTRVTTTTTTQVRTGRANRKNQADAPAVPYRRAMSVCRNSRRKNATVTD